MNWKKTLKKNKNRFISLGFFVVASCLTEIKFFIIIEYMLKAETLLCAVKNGFLATTCMMFLCVLLIAVMYFGEQIEEVK